jgi:hypothetical protein
LGWDFGESMTEKGTEEAAKVEHLSDIPGPATEFTTWIK